MTSSLELALCRVHQRNHCVLVSSATVGLTLTLEALNLAGLGVAMPSGVCLNVPLAIKYAGARPVYCDIDADTLGLSVETMSASGQQFSAVMAVHAYGNVCDIEAISGYCTSANIPLIEDVAMAQGANSGGRPVGSYGVASVVSFGKGKIIDVGGGGAILTDDAVLAIDLRKSYARLGQRNQSNEDSIDSFSSQHTQLYNRHYGIDLPDHIAPFIQKANDLKGSMMTASGWDQHAAEHGITRLTENLARRRSLAEYVFSKFESVPQIHCQRPTLNSSIWRANILVPNVRNKVLNALLEEGHKISSWYPPAQDFLELEEKSDTLIAKRIGDEILNVWINDEVDTQYLDAVSMKVSNLVRSRI